MALLFMLLRLLFLTTFGFAWQLVKLVLIIAVSIISIVVVTLFSMMGFAMKG